nr:MAG: replication associated protein [Cressdnaviricota sp.]
MTKKIIKNRNYCFTIFNINNIPNAEEIPEISFLIFQEEECPETKRHHLQGYVEFNQPLTMGQIKKIFNDKTMHLEIRRGSQEEAIIYCSKEETRIGKTITYGTPAQQGKRTDLDCLLQLKSMTISEFVVNNTHIAIKYPQGIKLIKQSIENLNIEKNREIEVTAIIGKPGSGKTRFVYENETDIYKLNTNSNGTLWFDGYEGQKVLLIDDFKGWIKYTDMLTILDRYPYRCQLKGSYTWANWKKIYITSNYSIDEWYTNENINMAALKRRIQKTIIQ